MATARFGPNGEYVYNVDSKGVPYGAPLPSTTPVTTTSSYSTSPKSVTQVLPQQTNVVKDGILYGTSNGKTTAVDIATGKVLSTTTASTPTDVSKIQSLPEIKMPTETISDGNISNAVGSTSGVNSLNESYIKEINDLNSQRQEAQKTQQSILQKLMNMNQQTTAETRQDLSEQYGIQAKVQEIDTLTQEYNKIKAAKDQQIAQTRDTLGSMNFINNQIQQIEQNAAPKLNELSANINSKAAILSMNQDLVNQAVQDAVADKKYQYDMIMSFYEMNQDVINRLDSEYRFALQNKIEQDKMAYEQALDEKNKVGEMMIDPALRGANITTNDTLEEAYRKASLVAGTNYVSSQNLIHGENNKVTTPSTLTDLTFKNTINAMKTDGATIDDVIQEIQMDKSISNKERGIELAKQIYGVSSTTPTTTPTTKSGGFLSGIFGSTKTPTPTSTTKQSYTPGSMIKSATGTYNPTEVSSFFTSLFE